MSQKCYFCDSRNVIITAVVKATKQKIPVCNDPKHRTDLLNLAHQLKNQ